MPKIIDNEEIYLRNELKDTLNGGGIRLDTAVGYFNLRGWDQIADAIEGLEPGSGQPAVRLLLGMPPNPENDLHQISQEGEQQKADFKTQEKLKEKYQASIKKQISWGVPSAKDETTLQKLNAQLKSGQIEARFYGEYPLHAKLYLCHLNRAQYPIVGYLGSSNLTFAGLAGQGELNVDVPDVDATEKLQAWFEKRWESAEGYDITEFLAQTIDKSWAGDDILSPYLIHLKLAYHLSHDAREGLASYELPPKMQKELLDFQSEAVRIAAQNLMNQGGALIADVVGLGKTLMATATALLLSIEHGYETLVICPKNLRPMWGAYMHKWEVRGKVMTLGETLNNLKKEERPYRLVVIDESHNLRTRGKKRWSAIKDYIDENEPKVLLLTATPYNKALKDIGGQLGLFIKDDADLGIEPSAAMGKERRDNGGSDQKFRTRCNDQIASLKAFELSKETEDWQNLLGKYMVRRTRSFIETNYAKEDESGRKYLTFANSKKKNYLPGRQANPRSIEFIDGDPAKEMESEKTIDAIKDLHLPRFGLGGYVSKEALSNATEEEKNIIKSSQTNGRSLQGLTRVQLYKRLSSSSTAFHRSLSKHLIKNIVVEQCLSSGQAIPTSAYEFDPDPDPEGEATESQDRDQEGQEEFDESIYENNDIDEWEQKAEKLRQSLIQNPPPQVTLLDPELFDNPKLAEEGKDYLAHLREDIAKLKNLLNGFGDITPTTDSKLKTLQEIVQDKHPDEKIIVFTEYIDTANYLKNALEEAGVKGGIESATGDTENVWDIAKRFSPRATNVDPSPNENEIRVVVATDVLSEGLNLQDARIVVNFDLPWGIIKLIQRAGRVDRIGQKAEKILIYSLLPSDGVEGEIKLRQRIEKRLGDNATVVGSDEILLGTPDEISKARREFLTEGNVPELDKTMDVDYVSYAYQIWNSASKKHKDEIKNLENMAHSTISKNERGEQYLEDKAGALIYTCSNYASGKVDRLAFIYNQNEENNQKPHVETIGPIDALKLTECNPGIPGLKRNEDLWDLVQKGVEEIKFSTQSFTEGDSIGGIRGKVKTKLEDILEGAKISLSTETLTSAHDAICKAPLTETASQNLSRKIRGASFEEAVTSLYKKGELVINTQNEPGTIDLICSMGFIE